MVDTANIHSCWSCKGPVTTGAPFCDTCGAVQQPGQVDHFTRMGLDVSFDVDVSALDQLYFSLQRQLHPDRFATKAPQEKALSQQQATTLNDAYETLKDPLMRADYLIHLKGIAVLPEGCNLVNDPTILMEAMEVREALASSENIEDVDGIAATAKAEIDDVHTGISKAFAGNDVEGACQLTTRLKYLRKLMDEIRMRRVQVA